MTEFASAADRADRRISFAEACPRICVVAAAGNGTTMVDVRTMRTLRVCVAAGVETKMNRSVLGHDHGAHYRTVSVRSVSGCGGGGIICSDVSRNGIGRPDRKMRRAPAG